jgi:predicted MFS family arabinose efflux permease
MMTERGMLRMLTTSSLHISGNYLYQFYMPVYAHAVGLSASAIGIVLAMNAAAEITVRLILPRLISRFEESNVLAYTLYTGAASLVLIPFFQNAAMLATISFIFGFAMGGAGPIITILMFANAPKGRSGEAMGFRMTVNFATKLASPVIFGAIASGVGMFHIFWLNALMLGAGGKINRVRPP